MADKRRLVVEIHADLSPFLAQTKAGLASVGNVTVPVGGAAGVMGGGLPGVPAAGMNVGATQAAVATAMAQAQQQASPYAMQAAFGGMGAGASSPNWGTLMQGAVQNAMYPTGASSPNWSYLMNQRGGATQPTPRPAAPGRNGFLGGAGLVRTLIASELVAEASNALQSSRQADSDAGFAGTSEERALIHAQAAERIGNGVIGRALTFIPDLLDLSGSPARLLREGREGVAFRRASDDQWGRRRTVEANSAYRDAYGTGGTTAAEAARSDSISNRRISDLQGRASDLSAQLVKRTAVTTRGVAVGEYETASITEGGDYELTGTARSAAQGELGTVNQELRDARDQARFEAARRADDVSDARRSVGNATRQAQLVARGGSSRDLARYDLGADASERMTGAFRNRGYAGMAEEWARFGADSAAQEFGFKLDDQSRDVGLAGDADVANLSAGGNSRGARIRSIQNRASEMVLDAVRKGSYSVGFNNNVAQWEKAQVNAVNADATRQFNAGQRGLAYQAYGLDRTLSNDPLGAQLGGIEANREEALQQARDAGLTPSQLARREQNVNRNAGLQALVAGRNYSRMRSDVNRRLDGAIEREQLGIDGGPTRGIRQAISSIIEQTDMDVRAMGDQGLGPEGERRKDLGRLQLRGAQADFYRSIQYREGSPRGVYGTGNLGGVRGAFKDADEQIGKTGRGETGGAAGAGWTPADVKQAIGYLQQMAQQGIAALAG
jgi:hypothetical protein